MTDNGNGSDNNGRGSQQSNDNNGAEETQRNILNKDQFELTDEQKQTSEDGFEIHGHGNGKIQANELKTLHGELGYKDPDKIVEKILKEADIEAESDIDKEDYDKLVKEMVWLEAVEECLKVCFKAFDKDGDGFIEADDLCRVMSEVNDPLNPDEIRGMMDQADGDCDGKITYCEFKAAMMKQST